MNYKEYYQSLTDEELIDFIVNESDDIRPEAFSDLYEVIFSRGLLQVLRERNIELEKPITDGELEELALKYMSSSCPECDKEKRINAIKFDRIRSIIFMTTYESEVFVGCQDCIKNELNAANSHNLLFGWWSIIGIFANPFTIIGNYIKYKKLNFDIPSTYFKEYIKKMKKDNMLD